MTVTAASPAAASIRVGSEVIEGKARPLYMYSEREEEKKASA